MGVSCQLHRASASLVRALSGTSADVRCRAGSWLTQASAKRLGTRLANSLPNNFLDRSFASARRAGNWTSGARFRRMGLLSAQ